MTKGRMRAALIVGLMVAPLLVVVPSSPAGASGTSWIDTSDREAVIDAYRAEFDRVEPASGWDGDVTTCTAGTTTQEYRDSVVQRVNWYRRMAGLGAVTERAAYTGAAQQTSMMSSAQGGVSHAPDAGWACHTAAGATAAGKSNLALGVNGIAAVDAYVRDPGSNNNSVGHRRTLLYPQLLEVGSGDVDTAGGHWAANTLHIFDDNLWAARPAVREARDFVAWPPAGYVPPQTAWGRWSFSLPDADFSAATVSVRDSLGMIRISILDRIQPLDPGSRIAPEPSLVWAIGDDTNSTPLPEPTDGDECYTVTVENVRIGGAVQPDYVYETCVLDLDWNPNAAPTHPDAAPPQNECGSVSFDGWTAPCWTDGGTLGGFTDVVTDWQRQPVAWLVGNGITTGVSPTRFEPDATLTRAQAVTLLWRLVGSPAPPSDAPSFVDVDPSSFSADAVRWMARYGITTGTGANRFSPDAPASRAEFVTFLWRLVDEPRVEQSLPFTDLDAAWQVGAVRWAAGAEITTGTSASSFSPNAAVTRGQAAALLARFAASLS